MRQLEQNKQKMFYSTPKDNRLYDSNGNALVNADGDYIVYSSPNAPEDTEDIYAKDEDGNIIYIEFEGERIPVVAETKNNYEPPSIFYANISFNSGETVMAEYGLNTSNYDAIISADKGVLGFNEQTLIWHTSEPLIDDYGQAIQESADYRVVAIKTSLNEERFILKKRVDDE